MPTKRRKERIPEYFPSRRRRTADHLIGPSGQIVQETSTERIPQEIEEAIDDLMDVADVATEGELLPGHVIVDEIMAHMDINQTVAHKVPRRGRNRHFLPLQPGIIWC